MQLLLAVKKLPYHMPNDPTKKKRICGGCYHRFHRAKKKKMVAEGSRLSQTGTTIELPAIFELFDRSLQILSTIFSDPNVAHSHHQNILFDNNFLFSLARQGQNLPVVLDLLSRFLRHTGFRPFAIPRHVTKDIFLDFFSLVKNKDYDMLSKNFGFALETATYRLVF